MLFLFMRIVMSIFPFLKEMCMSVDRGNYSKVATVMTVLLLTMIVVNIIGSRVVFVSVTQRNAALKENKELLKQLEQVNATQCTDKAHLVYIAELTLSLRACTAKCIK